MVPRVVRDELGNKDNTEMSTQVYIRGLSGAGFRVPKVGGGYGKVTENTTFQVDIDDHKTQLVLAGERDNFIRVSGSGVTTATIVGLSRRGFRINRSSDGAKVICKIGTAVTVTLTDPNVKRILRRNKRAWVSASSATAATIRGVATAQRGFDVKIATGATATLSSDGTNPAVGDTVTINDKTYRFESTLAQANDVKIGASSDATLDSLVKAVNQTGVVGTDYFTGTTAPTNVTAAARTGTGATGKVVFTATVLGTAGNAFPSTDTSAHLSFTGTTFAGGLAAANAGPTKLLRGVSATVDTTVPFNFQQLRRQYNEWIEG